MIYRASQPEISALIVEAYGFSKREVAHLVLAGLSTQEIADHLHLFPHTVQDHLKAIFAKVRVRSRRELVARVLLRHPKTPDRRHGGIRRLVSGDVRPPR